jgi:tyrosyl-tRNA synthetase
MDKITELLTRGVEKIYPTSEELEKVLRSGKKLKIYQGFDPTSPQFHIGHMVGLRKLRQWQDLGHEVIFLIGDATATIGDPSGKFSARKVLTREEVLENAKTYKLQAGKILPFDGPNPAKVFYNSEWLEKMNYVDLIKLSHYLSVNQVIERDMFQKRIQQKQDIFMNEFMYPVLQAYDSVAMNVDVEVGGSDQMFNMMMGRKLMRHIFKKEKFVMTTPLLTDSRGVKIGKTEGNAIALTDKPEDLFAKIMGLPDDVITKCFEYLTDVSMNEIKKINENLGKGENPIAYKKKLAFEIVKQLNNQDVAKKAEESFKNIVQDKEIPIEIYTANDLHITILDLISELSESHSKSEAKRLIQQNAISINGKKIILESANKNIEKGMTVKIGKRKFVKIEIK